MQKIFCLIILLTPLVNYAQDLTEKRWLFNSAYQAIQEKDWDTFTHYALQLKDYQLYYFLQYHYLNAHLKTAPASQIQAFLKQYGQTFFGEKLRRQWLNQLGKVQDWGNFLHAYTPQKSTILQCYYAQARLATGQQTQATLEAVRTLWLVGKSQPKACNPIFDYLYQNHLLDDAVVWQRISLLMAKGKTRLAHVIAQHLSPPQQHRMAQWQAMHTKSAQTLKAFSEPDTPQARDIVTHGLKRLAKKEFSNAQALWYSLQRRYRFSAPQKVAIQRALAFAGMRQNHPNATHWLKTLPKEVLEEKLEEARLTFALKRQDWQAVVDFTKVADKDNLRQRYWQARGLEQTAQCKKARKLYEILAKQRDYYGFLAASRLGTKYAMQEVPILFTPKEKKKLLSDFSIQSAYEFFLLGQLKAGRLEWNHAVGKLSPDQQAVAAALANRWYWHDRAIVTAAKAGYYDAVGVRFPLPYRVNLAVGAKRQGLDLAWVYGIVRQESLFMVDARSRSGALGLMQLMPATGRMVARQLGIKIKNNRDILAVDTNISLGTAYLRQMLERFNGNYMLATAAYNAGPGRAKRWAKERGCLPADVWVELIPFSETRTYVRRVLFYTAIFENRLGQQQRPIRIAMARGDCPIVTKRPCSQLNRP